MSPPIGQKLRVRAMIYVAGEPIPSFWPMRAFIHHNPLHGLEDLPFAEAVEKGARLFHARGFLPRPLYRRYLADGKVDLAAARRSRRCPSIWPTGWWSIFVNTTKARLST